MQRDRKFLHKYWIVFGSLAFIVLALLIRPTNPTQELRTSDSREYRDALEDRIRPFGQVYMPGEEIHAGKPLVIVATQFDPVATTMSGPQVYNAACIACHATGVGGAPTVGDAAAWQARVAQGNDVLYSHAIDGYIGSAGFMPQKGGRDDLSNDEVRGAVDYMVAQLQNSRQ